MNEAQIRQRLHALLQDVDDTEKQADGNDAPVELDQTSIGRLSRMDAMQQQAMALATTARRKVQKQRLMNALKRLDEGWYGECAECGDDIARARLDHDPAAHLCISCAR